MIINSDVFDIAKRVKTIDKSYLINWNEKKQRYEVVRMINNRLVVELIIPYSALDVRTIILLHKSSIKNIHSIIRAYEHNNYKLSEDSMEEQKYRLAYDLKLLFQ